VIAVKEKRRRRSAEEARAEILAVAGRLLAQGGPDAVRLQAIADEMGVTHPALLRHFGTREELLHALLRHAGRRLRAALAEALPADGAAAPDLDAFAAALERIYRDEGYARLSIWLTLAGFQPQGSGMFRAAAEEAHRARVRAARGRAPELEDTLFAVLLVNLAVWADALSGNAFRRAVELPGDRDTARRFREWLVRLVAAHLAQ
jgi:TetR/AcrR family transcriptional regulator, repressor for neighboring sulfatase